MYLWSAAKFWTFGNLFLLYWGFWNTFRFFCISIIHQSYLLKPFLAILRSGEYKHAGFFRKLKIWVNSIVKMNGVQSILIE